MANHSVKTKIFESQLRQKCFAVRRRNQLEEGLLRRTLSRLAAEAVDCNRRHLRATHVLRAATRESARTSGCSDEGVPPPGDAAGTHALERTRASEHAPWTLFGKFTIENWTAKRQRAAVAPGFSVHPATANRYGGRATIGGLLGRPATAHRYGGRATIAGLLERAKTAGNIVCKVEPDDQTSPCVVTHGDVHDISIYIDGGNARDDDDASDDSVACSPRDRPFARRVSRQLLQPPFFWPGPSASGPMAVVGEEADSGSCTQLVDSHRRSPSEVSDAGQNASMTHADVARVRGVTRREKRFLKARGGGGDEMTSAARCDAPTDRTAWNVPAFYVPPQQRHLPAYTCLTRRLQGHSCVEIRRDADAEGPSRYHVPTVSSRHARAQVLRAMIRDNEAVEKSREKKYREPDVRGRMDRLIATVDDIKCT